MNKIQLHFSKTVDDYDTVDDKVVMKNKELHETLIKSIPFDCNKRINILDLGCGTGHSMILALKLFPNAKLTGIDFSHKMIHKSQKNLNKFSDRIRLLNEDFNKTYFPEKYDAVISVAAIHNSTHLQKAKLFQKIFLAINRGGVFLNGDFIKGETDELNKQYQQIYRNYLIKNLKNHELEVWLKHAFQEDKPMRLSDQFKLLKKNGFNDNNLIWQYNNQAIYFAKKL